MLIGARFIQGIGGALASAVILGMIVTMFPEPAEQAKAIGVYGFVASAGGSIGLLLGGVLTEAISWHWIFIINLPIGIAVAFLALRLVADRDGIGLSEGADFPGAALITGSLMLGVFTILQITEWGWVDARTLVLSAVSAALLALFIHRQATIANPLMPLRLFRSRNVAGANVLQALLVAGMFGMFFLGALYLQRVLGYSPLEVGLAFLPTTIVMGALSLGFSEKLIMRFGPRTTLIPGVCLVVVALLLFARTPVDGNYLTDLLPPFLLIGVGVGTSFPAIMTLAMSGATPEDAGLASGLVNTSMQVGGAIGLAVLATLSTERTNSLLDDGDSSASALTSGYHVAYLIGAGLAAIAVAIAVFVLRADPPAGGTMPAPPRRASAEPEPALLRSRLNRILSNELKARPAAADRGRYAPPLASTASTMPAFAEAPDERARMGRISGCALDRRRAGRRRRRLPARRRARRDCGWVLGDRRLVFLLRRRQRHRLAPLGAGLDERPRRSAWW